jgi:phage shock protein C
MKKLLRSKADRKIAGIFGGFGKMYEIDSNILRLLAILVALVTAVFPIILTYIIAWIIVPEEIENLAENVTTQN